MNKLMSHRWIGWAAVALSAVFLLGAVLPKNAGAEEVPLRIISVAGRAEVKVKPDMASIVFGVETNAPTARQAQSQNAEIMNRVIARLKSSGIAQEDMQTSNFSLRPVYEWRTNKEESSQVLVGYRCNNSVKVVVKDIAKTGTVIDYAVEAGATNVQSLSFGVLDPQVHQDEALALAVENVRVKAEVMAKAAGVEIIGINRISDGSSVISVPSAIGRFDDAYSDMATAIEPGEITIIGTVNIEFTF